MNIMHKLTAVARLVAALLIALRAGLQLRDTIQRMVHEELDDAVEQALDDLDSDYEDSEDEPMLGSPLDLSHMVAQVHRRMQGIAATLAEAVRTADAKRAAEMRDGPSQGDLEQERQAMQRDGGY